MCDTNPAPFRRRPSLAILWMEKAFHPNNDLIIAVIVNLLGSLAFFGITGVIRPFPGWLPLATVAFLEVILILTYRLKMVSFNQALGYVVTVIQFSFVLVTVVNLIQKLPQHKEIVGEELLRSGALLWFANLLVFTIWYWRFDGGGPHLRDPECRHISFLFPQLLLDEDQRKELSQDKWRPGVVDYLFLAFNTSTALSPADTAVLGRGAKVTSMLQSALALAIVVVVIGRGVNAM
jgi:hypothetical protein